MIFRGFRQFREFRGIDLANSYNRNGCHHLTKKAMTSIFWHNYAAKAIITNVKKTYINFPLQNTNDVNKINDKETSH